MTDDNIASGINDAMNGEIYSLNPGFTKEQSLALTIKRQQSIVKIAIAVSSLSLMGIIMVL